MRVRGSLRFAPASIKTSESPVPGNMTKHGTTKQGLQIAKILLQDMPFHILRNCVLQALDILNATWPCVLTPKWPGSSLVSTYMVT